MNRGAKCWMTILSQRIDPMLLQENILDTIIIIMKRKEKPTSRLHARNTLSRKQVVLSRIFKRMVPVDYSYQSKKKYQEPFHLLVQ